MKWEKHKINKQNNKYSTYQQKKLENKSINNISFTIPINPIAEVMT